MLKLSKVFFSAAEKPCDLMLEEKISPNVVTYSTMIDGCG
jgi:hypothetical protein